MKFQNRIKGAVTEALVEAIFRDAGFSVTPLGIEEEVRWINELDINEYKDLGLPIALRKLPDFLVVKKPAANSDYEGINDRQWWLVEVKYQVDFEPDTLEKRGLKEQVKAWQPLTLVIFKGGNQNSSTGHATDFVRAGRLVMDGNDLKLEMRNGHKKLWKNVIWKDLSGIQYIFGREGEQTIPRVFGEKGYTNLSTVCNVSKMLHDAAAENV